MLGISFEQPDGAVNEQQKYHLYKYNTTEHVLIRYKYPVEQRLVLVSFVSID